MNIQSRKAKARVGPAALAYLLQSAASQNSPRPAAMVLRADDRLGETQSSSLTRSSSRPKLSTQHRPAASTLKWAMPTSMARMQPIFEYRSLKLVFDITYWTVGLAMTIPLRVLLALSLLSAPMVGVTLATPLIAIAAGLLAVAGCKLYDVARSAYKTARARRAALKVAKAAESLVESEVENGPKSAQRAQDWVPARDMRAPSAPPLTPPPVNPAWRFSQAAKSVGLYRVPQQTMHAAEQARVEAVSQSLAVVSQVPLCAPA